MKEKLYTVKIISIHSYTAKDIETALQTCFGAFKEISVIDEAAEQSVQRTGFACDVDGCKKPGVVHLCEDHGLQ